MLCCLRWLYILSTSIKKFPSLTQADRKQSLYFHLFTSRQRRGIRAVIPGPEAAFPSSSRLGRKIRELGNSSLSLSESELFWRKRKCARSESLIRQAKGGPHRRRSPMPRPNEETMTQSAQ